MTIVIPRVHAGNIKITVSSDTIHFKMEDFVYTYSESETATSKLEDYQCAKSDDWNHLKSLIKDNIQSKIRKLQGDDSLTVENFMLMTSKGETKFRIELEFDVKGAVKVSSNVKTIYLKWRSFKCSEIRFEQGNHLHKIRLENVLALNFENFGRKLEDWNRYSATDHVNFTLKRDIRIFDGAVDDLDPKMCIMVNINRGDTVTASGDIITVTSKVSETTIRPTIDFERFLAGYWWVYLGIAVSMTIVAIVALATRPRKKA
ncbi:MAG: hypothetical protein QXP20_07450 [Candidatus Bathyarchaeia archaeon]